MNEMTTLPYGASPTSDNQYASSAAYGAVAAPNLSTSSLKPGNRAIRDATQAKNIITSLEVNNRQRNVKAARIQAKLNSEKPHTDTDLKQDGLSWKSNFTTKPLVQLAEKIGPRFVTAVQGMKYLTNSKLSDDIEGASTKTEAFRREITSVVRDRAGWQGFLSEVSQENAIFGYAAVAILDEFRSQPKFFRQDEFFVPTTSKQHPDQAQVVVLRERYLLHDLFRQIEDKEAADTAGWDVKETAIAINNAIPEDRRRKWSNWERLYEDMIRESNVGISYENGPRVVTVWHLLATEVTGKVSHYVYEEKSFAQLFKREDQFESMSQVVAFFSFQQGNGTMHGSKGIGRELYALAAMLDRTRNEIVDRLNLSGKMVIQCDEKAIKKFRMSVVGNTILIGKGYDVLDRKIDGEVEPFLKLDQFLSAILDQLAGATTPRVFEGERVTKAQVDFFAAREEETKDSIIARFLNQFADMMSMIQRRLCDPHTLDEDAKDMQKRLLNIMSREELDKLSHKRVAETVKDATELDRQKIIIVAQEGRGNPLYNQRELEKRKIIAQVDEEFAEAVLLPEEDPTVEAEQSRLQMFELQLLTQHATHVPVSPRDNHLVHLQFLMPALEQAANQAKSDPHAVETLKAFLTHATDHVNMALQSGYPKDQLAEAQRIVTQLAQAMPQLEQAAQAQLAQEGQLANAGPLALPPEAGANSPLAAPTAQEPPPPTTLPNPTP
jgi:hypothetical protein